MVSNGVANGVHTIRFSGVKRDPFTVNHLWSNVVVPSVLSELNEQWTEDCWSLPLYQGYFNAIGINGRRWFLCVHQNRIALVHYWHTGKTSKDVRTHGVIGILKDYQSVNKQKAATMLLAAASIKDKQLSRKLLSVLKELG